MLAIIIYGSAFPAAGGWDSEVDSVLHNCNLKDVAKFYDELKARPHNNDVESRNVWNARMLRLAIRLSSVKDIARHWDALDTNGAYSLNGKKEICRACKEYVEAADFNGCRIDAKKSIPVFDKKKGDMIFSLPHYDVMVAHLYLHLRDFDKSIERFRSVISFTDSVRKTPSLADIRYESMLGIAEAYVSAGRYEEAIGILRGFDEDAMKNTPSILQSVHRLYAEGRLRNILGDNHNSEKYLTKAIDMLTGNGEDGAIIQIKTYQALGETLMALGDYGKALEVSTELENVILKNFGRQSPVSLAALALRMDAMIAMGQHEEALEAEEESQAINFDLSSNPMAVFYWSRVYESVAEGLLKDGIPNVAALFLETTGDLYESLDVKNSLLHRNLYNNLGFALVKGDNTKKASSNFARQLEIDRKFAHDVFLFLPEARRAAYWAQTEPLMNRLFSLNREGSVTLPDGNVTAIKAESTTSEIGGILYDASLLNKGLMLQATVNLKKLIAETGDAHLSDVLGRLSRIRSRQAAGAEMTAEEQSEAEKLEQLLVKGSRRYGDFMQFTETRWQDIRDRLGVGETAVEFVMSRDEGMQYYSAEVIRHDMQQPEHIFLFGIKEADRRYDRDDIYDAALLYNKVWKKILQKCNPGETIYFSPAGKFYNLAIEHAVLPDGGRVNTVYNPVRLSSTRELARLGEVDTQREAVLYGGLNYDMSIFDMELMAMETRMDMDPLRGVSGMRVEDRNAWNYLPGTLGEVIAISEGWRNTNADALRVVSGMDGTEESFKTLSGEGKGIIHIATHGFYIPMHHDGNDVLRSAYATNDESLLRSALVLSGGNNGWLFPERIPDGVDDGVLTAKEISELDLSGTSLVVMSACQTGLGDISNEGVFGLQRAFKLAGVGSLVMSLAPVHDDATRLLMTEFYAGIDGGLPKREAFRKAQEAVRGAQFEINGKIYSGSEPRFWAPFVIMD